MSGANSTTERGVTDNEVKAAIAVIESASTHGFVPFGSMRRALEAFAQSRQPSAQGGERVEPQIIEGMVRRFIALEAEVDAGWSDVAKQMLRELRGLIAMAAASPPAGGGNEALSDAERMDWLERQDLNDLAFGYVIDAPQDGSIFIGSGDKPHYAKTLRAAIDAAIRAGRKG